MNKGKKDLKLIQFKISRKAYDNLKLLKEETGNLNLSELIRDSIKFYTWAVKMKKKGYKLYFVPNNGTDKKSELMLPTPF